MLRLRSLALFVAVVLVSFSAFAQTFRGTLTGVVVDAQGAVIPNASVQLKSPSTSTIQEGKSNGSGEFTFPELAPGVYELTVTFPGFQTKKIDDINVQVSKVVEEKVELVVGAESTVVDIVANGVQVETASSSLVSVVDTKSVADMPMNGRDFTKMVRFSSNVVGSGAVNGRSSSINYQVDGTDNVDAYLNAVASNQGGVAGIAGGLVPIEAIDQFSMQSNAEADMGRNAGANQNMVLKSGTNQIHGDAFFFNRNEFFAALSPVASVTARKPVIRNNQFGFTLGGPIWKDHTFLFLAGEIQLAEAGNSTVVTVINNDWVAAGNAYLAAYGITTDNQVTFGNGTPGSLGLYNTLFPKVADTPTATVAGAVTNNYFASAPDKYNSYNGVIKLDHHFSEKVSLSMRYLGTTGRQTAETSSYYAQYFQTAPMHIHNFSIIQTTIFSPKLLNQVNLGTNYFLQTFNDADQNFYPAVNDGLNLGLTGIIAAGSPTISVSGFQSVGATQPSGRTDVTGQITDSLRWTLGKHSLKIGGEYRHTNVNLLYFSNSRGSFTFDGTGGPWSTTSKLGTITAACRAAGGTAAASVTGCANYNCTLVGQTSSGSCNTNILGIADFLYGQTSASTSSASKLLQGDAQRVYLLNTEEAWVQDDFQLTRQLSLNYGLRWSVPGVVHDAKNDLTSFVAGPTVASPIGFVTPLYDNYYKAFAPRVGFSYSPFPDNKTAIRGSWGIFYDVPAMSTMVSGSTANSGAGYTQLNPAGPDPAYTLNAATLNLPYNMNPFTGPGATIPQFGAVGVQPHYRLSYAMNFSLGIEQQFTKSTLFSLGYSGSEYRRGPMLYDLNQAIAYNATTKVYTRPYDAFSSGFPGETVSTTQPFLGINQLTSGATSNYSSVEASIRQSMWKGVTANINYIWSHALDDGSGLPTTSRYNVPNAPRGGLNKYDYATSSNNTPHTVNGFITYNMPQFGHYVPRLTKGWQVNALFTFYDASPINATIGKDYAFSGESTGAQRSVAVPGVSAYVPKTTITSATTGARTYQLYNRAAFDYPISGNTTGSFGVYSPMQRDSYLGTGFGDVDFSLFKYTPVTDKVNSEFRVEVFNILNQSNLSSPSISSLSSSTFGQATNTRNGSSAPGLGYGEPFNVQFALKILF